MLPRLSRHVSTASSHIRPGLERISQLLADVETPWRSIHVAGTNGKGSICAYLTGMLQHAHVRTGQFTSPHIVDRWDCIQIDQEPISASKFRELENAVKERNDRDGIHATSFEILTATAFEIFTKENVSVAIVECGMGGRLDATNVLQSPLATVLSRIGLDHQAFLGDTYAQIAAEKAGIMKRGSPCVIESNSPMEALQSIAEKAAALGIETHYTPLSDQSKEGFGHEAESSERFTELFDIMGISGSQIAANQAQNMWCAYKAIQLALPGLGLSSEHAKELARAMPSTALPGRLQKVGVSSIIPQRREPVILDGAHNDDAFNDLVKHLAHLRRKDDGHQSIVWIIALSGGKDPGGFLRRVGSNDIVIAAEFGPVDGMPWVQPVPVQNYNGAHGTIIPMGKDIQAVLQRATELAGASGPVVVTGSLYLISDVLRWLRDAAP